MPAAEDKAEQNSSDVELEDLMPPNSQNHHLLHENNTNNNINNINNSDIEENDEHEDEEDEDEDEEDGNNEDGDAEDDKEKSTHDEEENTSQLSSGDEVENNMDEFILVRLADIRKEVQCPICLGIIRKTRTVMECLHRFCRECIDKSMRMGNNECPACRTHCASRRSLRDDPNYDALIAAIYPDIDQYEEEEMSFQEDEKARNKQIQAAIAQTFRRQTEALSKKRKRSQNTYRRKRANYRSDDEEEANGHDGGKDSSSADERCTEVKSKRLKRWRGQPSPAGGSGDRGGDVHDDQEVHKEAVVAPVGLVIGSPEMLAWGKGGIRSNTRYASGAGANAKHSRSRLARLGDHLRNLTENDNEPEIQVALISLDQQKSSALTHPFLSVRPALSVSQLCQFIALQTSLPPERVEILAAKGASSKLSSYSTLPTQLSSSIEFEACKDDLQVLDSEETLAGLRNACTFARGHLMLAYRQKEIS
ncbi:hypothetical protein RND81_10G041500 [Saponaria officinalis]|uniref:RING-type domain-containing protein n=1 Tax=Saponaria officinalis TaxID=3572 RepID=A0AAW1HYI6_SAPOF